ncbi:hypothetical protein BLA60_03615 [Actinophytocola xinjiangensis]|uniref:Zinc ribbon protein n=1 Tax=Actinophytocola xinjiangensis TaxID=485602 RepID=A0A7Z0WSX7_9PSEU|nr:zinc ribbon domain-containing protein [Actinophytocola xinjiangensis]OLF14234.1 hypothetical protein BLA60_03615 [Actinophytocola xinjiangensis]
MTRNLRTGLRIAGIVLVLGGVVLAAIGFIDFFGSMGHSHDGLPGDLRHSAGESRFPTMFWMTFVGLPMIAGGVACLKAGFLGVASRYVADESQAAVRQVSQAAATGWRAGSAGPAGFCHRCGTPQQQDARFCHRCGAPTVRPGTV